MALQRVRSNMLANNFVLDDDQGLIVGSGNNIYIDTVNNRVGINTNSPTHDLTVSGNIHATGTITAGGDITLGDSDADTLTITAEIGSDILPDIDNTYDLGSSSKKWAEVHATSFYGDGSNLTGITSSQVTGLTTDNVAEGSNLYYTDARADARATLRITAADIGNLNNVDETGVANGKVLKYNSTSTNWEVGDADVIADTTPQLGGNLDLNSNDITGTGNINITGDVTATNFIGDGSQLTGLASTLDEVTTNGATTTNSITVGGLIVNSTGAVDLPVGTTAQRPTAADGQIRFNSDLVAFEGYDGTEWGALGGGGATYSTTAPTTNLKTGDLWFDTGTTGELYVYSGTEWLSTTGASGSAFYARGFTGDNTTTVYTVGGTTGSALLVYLNGVLLSSPADYSYASGDVTFVTAPPLNSEIKVLVYSAASGVSQALNDLTDVNLSVAPTDGQSVIWDATNSQWIAGDSFSQTDFDTALGQISTHIIPDTNISYDLGSTTNRFRDLYLSGNTINLGTVTIGAQGDGIAVPRVATDVLKVGDSVTELTPDNKMILPRGNVKIGSASNFADLPEVDLTIAPEVLEIQVDAPAAGQDTAWLWTWEQSTLPYARRTITNSNEAQVPLYKQGTYVVNNFAAYTTHGSMTQTHSLYLKWIDGAGTDNLVSWATSAGPISDTHPDINGGAATDVQRITVNVPATVTPPTLTAPSVDYTVANNGNGAYTFSGPASGDNPNIGPLYRGGTYTFDVSASGHPFYLTTDNGTNFSAGTYFGEYTSGVTNSRTDSGTVTFVVPSNAPDTLYYQCGNHSVMRGAITVKDLAVETNINGNYVVYFQHTQEGHKTPIEIRPIPSLVNQMCLVYDNSVNRFVPQDLATYVENTPSFENKIREVAGTAELVVEDGSAVVAKVNVYDDSTYLPLTGNNPGDQAFATDNNILYIWDGSAWQQAGATNTDEITEGTTNLFYTDARVGTYLSSNGYQDSTTIIASITDSAPTTLDTLNELAAALGDDPNFATTVTNNIATKAPINNPTFTGVISGDGSGLTNIPSGISRTTYTTSLNQTSFSATYTSGNVDVYLNGVKLARTTDYDDTSGTAIVLTSGVPAGRTLEIVTYNTFTVADVVPASTGGTFLGPISSSGLTVTHSGNFGIINNIGQPGQYSGIKFSRGVGDYSSNIQNNLGILVTDNGLEVSKFTAPGKNVTGRDQIITFSNDKKVGVGTTSPSRKLHVVSDEWNNTTGASVIVENTGNIGAGITLKTTSSSNPNGWAMYAGGPNANIGNGSIGFYDHGAGAERWYLDATGAQHLPDQPGCMIYCQSQDINWTSGNLILYGNNSATSSTSIRSWDTTNSYSMANSNYTAPVAGKYYLSFTANGVNTGAVPRAYPRVNGSYLGHNQHIRGNNTITGDLDQRTYAGVITLQANDVVDVYVGAGTWDTFGCNYFCIYKLS